MKKTAGLIIPVLNEEKTLNAVLDCVLDFGFVSQVVVVNDGSVDGTAKILQERLKRGEPKVRVVTHDVNQGKGTAIQSALKVIETDYAAIQDADLEYDPGELEGLFEMLDRGAADVIYGSRFLTANPNIYPMYLMGNKIMSASISLLGGRKLTDTYTCYKAMTVERWRALGLKSRGFEIEAEITMKCLMAGWKILEHPIHYHPRSFQEGKKIRGTDAIKGLIKALKVKFKID